jgi:hypothetical protein
MGLTTIAAGLALGLVPVGDGPEVGTQLFPNPDLAGRARGWILKRAELRPHDGPDRSAAVLLPGDDDSGDWSNLGVLLEDPPRLRSLELGVSLRGPAGAQVTVNAFAYRSGNEKVAQWSDTATLASDDWQTFATTYVVPPNARRSRSGSSTWARRTCSRRVRASSPASARSRGTSPVRA